LPPRIKKVAWWVVASLGLFALIIIIGKGCGEAADPGISERDIRTPAEVPVVPVVSDIVVEMPIGAPETLLKMLPDGMSQKVAIPVGGDGRYEEALFKPIVAEQMRESDHAMIIRLVPLKGVPSGARFKVVATPK